MKNKFFLIKNKLFLNRNNRRRYLIWLLCAVVLIIAAAGVWACTAKKPVRIDGYVYDSCGGCFTDNAPCKPCKVVIGLEQYLFEALDKAALREHCEVEVHNVLSDKEKQALARSMEEFAAGDTGEYPVVFVNCEKLQGWTQIKEAFSRTVAEAVGKAPADVSMESNRQIILEKATSDTVVYFKMTACSSCKKAGKLLTELSAKTNLFELLTYDLEEPGGLEMFQAYCGTYGVDADTASVPMVFIGDKYLESFEEMELFLEAYLESGLAQTTYRIS